MSRIFVVAHKRTVGSGAELAKNLGVRCIVPRFPPKGGFKDGDTLINWGIGSIPSFASQLADKKVNLINAFLNVRGAINKARALSILQDADVPSLHPITNIQRALRAYGNSRPTTKLFARELLCGSQGEGITVFNNYSDFCSYPPGHSKFKLFTIGFPKNREFRVHVIDGKVVDYSQKKRMKEDKLKAMSLSSADKDIRSHGRGWVFAKVNVERFPEIEELAISAVNALELSFGAVDILARCVKGELVECVVCEVNTAPALSADSTMDAYVGAFSEMFKEKV